MGTRGRGFGEIGVKGGKEERGGERDMRF